MVNSRTGYHSFHSYILSKKKELEELRAQLLPAVHDSMEFNCTPENQAELKNLVFEWSKEYHRDYDLVKNTQIFEELGT